MTITSAGQNAGPSGITPCRRYVACAGRMQVSTYGTGRESLVSDGAVGQGGAHCHLELLEASADPPL